MQEDTVYQRIARHVEELFRTHEQPTLHYHSLEHTETVAEHALLLAGFYKLDDRDRLIVYTAAWFHDTGHLTGDIIGHEERSVQMMRAFMSRETDDENFLSAVEDAILATRFPSVPQGLVASILCDADTWHFGTPDFIRTNKQVRRELKERGHKAMAGDWKRKTLSLLLQHHFFTSYCKEHLAAGKEENIALWREKVAEDGGKEEKKTTGKKEKEGKAEKKDALVTRGIQTMLRLTSENHLRLSEMADGKANILISVNSIIIGVILSVLLRRLEIDTYLTIPTMIFLASSVITIIIAILATLPKVTQGRFNREDIIGKKVNLLFFGNFYRSSHSEYEWAMNRLMQDREYLYGSLVKDIYQLGVVLGKKYRLIRLAYYVFMFGIIISVIAFTMAVLLRTPQPTPHITNGTQSPL